MTTRKKPIQPRRHDAGFAQRVGLLQLAVAVLGDALVGHITGAYTVAGLSTGVIHIVTIRDAAPYCVTCSSDNDDHTAVVRLYRARLGTGV